MYRFERFSPFMSKVKTMIDALYFIVFVYGAYQLIIRFDRVALALDLIAKK